jgi:hypothetical protein
MWVTITKIDKSNPRDVEGSLYYPVVFCCSLVEGTALLNSPQNIKSGDSISVETAFEALSNLQVLTTTRFPKMIALQTVGHYEVVGVVSFVSGDGVFYIDVDDFTFRLNSEDTEGFILSKGEWVSFAIHGLVFYDENI